MKVKIRVLDEFKSLTDAAGVAISLVPTKATPGSAAFDLKAAVSGIVPAGEHKKIWCDICGCTVVTHTPGRFPVRNGIAMEIPDGYEGQVRPRSGNARKNGIGIPNSPATIDSDYRGELVTTLINFGGEPFVFAAGDRIAQILFKECPPVAIEVVEKLSDTSRGAGGFGSTGVK